MPTRNVVLKPFNGKQYDERLYLFSNNNILNNYMQFDSGVGIL